MAMAVQLHDEWRNLAYSGIYVSRCNLSDGSADGGYLRGECASVDDDNVSYMSMGPATDSHGTRHNSFGHTANIVLQDLNDFHYGEISKECAKALCEKFGDFLLRTERSINMITVKSQDESHIHLPIITDTHPVLPEHETYFLDEKTRHFFFIRILDLMQYLVTTGYLPQIAQEGIPLQPCSKAERMVINSADISSGKMVNPNPISSKTYYSGNYGTRKVVLVKKMSSEKIIEEANNQTEFISHPNILKMMGICVQNPVCLVLPEEAQYLLHEYIKNLRSSKRKRMINICHDICCGMIYLHSIRCLHRSLQSRACMINPQSHVAKIFDFDKSIFIKEDLIEPEEDKPVMVPTRWAAPEVLKHSEFSMWSDVWSFGVFTWEVFNNGKIPYTDLKNDQLLKKLKPGFRLTLTVKKQKSYDIILEKCLRYNRNNRPSFDYLEGIIRSLL